ncbi:MAG TPA: Abi-alpha family protein [Thermoleophilaceae bacterium]|nr:Abi-alpha family protein [Thermoleophilaceae bacterium]
MSDPDDDLQEDGQDLDTAGLLAAAPALARLAVHAGWRTAGWTAGSSVRAGGRMLDAARSGQPPTELLAQAGAEARDYALKLLGLAEAIEAVVAQRTEDPSDDGGLPQEDAPPAPEVSQSTLRARGEELLRQSADVRYHEEAHPAYERILGELAPDDARILRFLFREGAQAAVDVRTSKTLGVTSEMVAPGLSLIGEQAGCRYLDRVPAYLNNLYRLGLIWFSREAITDPLEYQVLEAQPKVTEALEASGRSKTVRRSIHLTPFGEDFCDVCLPTDITGEFEAVQVEAEPRDDLPNVSRKPV